MDNTRQRNGMVHMNGNMLCAIDCETTGNVPGEHDIFQVCVLPLTAAIEPWKEFPPFDMVMKLKRPENIDPKIYKGSAKERICKAQISGIDPWRAADLFDEWVGRLKLPFGKQIIPLAHNWPRDREFYLDWLGRETFNQLFSSLYRDTMTAAAFMNDKADMHTEFPVPFSKYDLNWVCKVFNVRREMKHDALCDAIATAEVYKLQLKSCK
jgi:DNA polymerase III epsilon subunit-like protein